jgi:hypothetical protein
MKEVWVLLDGDDYAFSDKSHLRRSIEITYSKLINVKISDPVETEREISFVVKCEERDGTDREDTIKFRRYDLMEGATHL